MTPIPKGKEKHPLYEPIGVKAVEPYTGTLKKLVDEANEKFRKGEINLIDFEELRSKAKEIDKQSNKQ